MPEVDGPELCRRMRARATDRYSYFLLVTATGGKKRYLEGMDAGADDFITKPIDMTSCARGSKPPSGSSACASMCNNSRDYCDLRVLQTDPGCFGKVGIDRTLCRRAIRGAIQSRVLSGLLREVRSSAD